ncbi:MAG: phosphatase PAP2 family protein [Syntrophaceae bacterium]|nr:phosphatase PAP2 family protein [Syntrophaceae bacterium]
MIDFHYLFYDWCGLNKALFLMINQIHSPLFDHFMLVITFLGNPGLFPFYISIALLLSWFRTSYLKPQNIIVFALSYVFISVMIVPFIKVSLNYPRPLAVLGENNIVVLGHSLAAHSFPSAHSAFAVLIVMSFWPGLPRCWQITLIMFASLICLSRISVGAHFPADVVGGILIAIFAVISVRLLLKYFMSTGDTCKNESGSDR